MSARPPTPLTRRAFVDSSGYLALVNPRDAFHASARAVWHGLFIREGWATFTSNFVIAEAHALFLGRLGRHHATLFLRQFETTATTILRVSPEDEEGARAIVYQYADKNFSLTDATSFTLMENHRIGAALTSDHNFRQYGFQMLGL